MSICSETQWNSKNIHIQGRIQVWAHPAPAPSFDIQIMQIQPIFGAISAIRPLFLQI